MFRSCRSVISIALAALALQGAALAQRPAVPASPATPATPAATPKPKFGYIRFWNMLPKTYGALALVPGGSAPGAEPMALAAPSNFWDSYTEVPPQRYNLAVSFDKDRTIPLQQFDVLLRKDVYITLLATEVDGKPKVEMVDDTYDPATTVAGKLTVRHFFPDAEVTVKVSTGGATTPMKWNEVQVVDGLPLQPSLLNMEAKMANGKVHQWSAELNPAITRRATLMLVPDPYGRFRPRLNPDGPSYQGAPPPPPAK